MSRIRPRLPWLVVAVVAAAGCGVQPSPARVVGPAPDTRPAAIAEARGDAGPAELTRPSRPGLDEEVADEEIRAVPVLLRDAAGPVWVQRVLLRASGDPVLDAVIALTEPLSDGERDAGLTTDVPVDTHVVGHEWQGDVLVVQVDGSVAGGTEATLSRRTQQVACTVAATEGLDPAVVEVTYGDEPLGRFGPAAEACPEGP